jgi:hypothetical protein
MAPPERLVRASCVSWAYEVRPAIVDALARLGPGGRHGDPAHDRDHRSADDDPMRTPVLPGILFAFMFRTLTGIAKVEEPLRSTFSVRQPRRRRQCRLKFGIYVPMNRNVIPFCTIQCVSVQFVRILYNPVR